MNVCRYLKRVLDTTNRYAYITYAYGPMARWMKQGNAAEKKLKYHVHRHFELPSDLPESIDPADAQDVLTEFGYHYIDCLLRYCGDDLKPGITCLLDDAWKLDSIIPTRTHSHTGHHIMSVKTTHEFKALPVGKVRHSHYLSVPDKQILSLMTVSPPPTTRLAWSSFSPSTLSLVVVKLTVSLGNGQSISQ